MSTTRKLPSRLHHTAYTTKDMEKTCAFYEEVIGLPLVATWSESNQLFGKVRTYCHCFFGLADGGALAFFQCADKDDERTFSPPVAETPFHHIALKVDKLTQEEIEQHIQAASYTAPDTFVLEHGYCRSLYIKDPNGMLPTPSRSPGSTRRMRTRPSSVGSGARPHVEQQVSVERSLGEASRHQSLSEPPNKSESRLTLGIFRP